MTLHFFNDVGNDAESIENNVIIASLKGESVGKLINRIPGSSLLISSFTRLGFENACCQQAFSKPCLVNLIYKDTHLTFFIFIFKKQFSLKHFVGSGIFIARG